jgi:hypothetical protein
MEFEWDEEKIEANLAKHGVTFDERKLSSTIRFMLISTILTIPLVNIAILSLESRDRGDC